jgi:hypothetical protein
MKLSGAENLLTLVAHFDVPNMWKTIGVLIYRGSQLPLIGAMSGWGYQDLHKANIQISRMKWTNEVKRFCRIVGHYFPHSDDQGVGLAAQANPECRGHSRLRRSN